MTSFLAVIALMHPVQDKFPDVPETHWSYEKLKGADLSFRITLAQDTTKLKRALDSICAGFHGRIGYSLCLPESDLAFSYNGDDRFPTASTIKTAIALEVVSRVEEGTLKMTDKRAVPPMSGRQASMWSYQFKDGTVLDVDGWTNLMITVSDNTATMVLRDWLTMQAINARLAKLGLKNTKVLGTFPPEDVLNNRLRGAFGLGVTTPNEMNRLFQLIYKRKATTEAGCEKLMRILSHQYWDDMAMSSVPLGVQVCCKSGAINRSRSEVATVFGPIPYIFSVYTDSQKDQSWNSGNEGEVAIRKIYSVIWNYMNPDRPYKLPKGYEKFMPTGGGV